ncbi:MAG: 4-hydroxythreonine-4-phosphate dehydrogenase PdxA [Deltaproteobacteria bacterium RBG_16_49_23]|nr:MAG: 4-hydroxythreonine-4-phosphate dehydrogenase PdxA [Deltaproteobacteria bacterium RBG_16_49_23]
MSLPIIGITMGDPTGIGPEIIIKAFSVEEPFQSCRPIVFGDREVLLNRIERESLSVRIKEIGEIPEEGYQPGKIFLLPSSRLEAGSLSFGKPDRKCGEAMVGYVEEAVRWLQRGKIDGLTTCPINKQAINKAGHLFSGHTELLAHLTQTSHVAMMFLGSKWKVVLVTTHLPLKEVSKWITRDRILTILGLTEEGLRRYFGVSQPRLAVLGLNPHCGEEGLLGEEEKDEIIPAIEEAKSLGMKVQGPFPADSFFGLSAFHPFDAVIAMYHDQGLIPIKIFDFKESVNFTLGLPFIRTSVAHGTAYDIAGKGLADPANLIKAIVTAANLSKLKREL